MWLGGCTAPFSTWAARPSASARTSVREMSITYGAAQDIGCEGAAAQQGDAADEAHGSWKDSKVSYLHLRGASQLIAGVGLQ